MKISVVEYQAEWKTMFSQEQAALAEILAEFPNKIEHIGSTSIEGLSAKPIIDVLVGLDNFGDADKVVLKMIACNYEYISKYEQRMPFRKFFIKKENGISTHNIHVVELKSEFWKRHLLFRDHLRKNTDDRLAYENLKKNLAEKEWEKGEDYADAKTEFIRNIEAKAK